MRLIVRIALVFLGCLLLLSSGLIASARQEAGTSSMWIYYASVRPNGITSLYRMLPNGSGQQLIVENTGFITRISFSPDGKSIVFDADKGQLVNQVYRADLDGGHLEPISLGFESAYAPAWSPNGEWVATIVCEPIEGQPIDPSYPPCTSSYGNQYERHSVYVMRPDGSERQRVAGTIPLGRLFWSPDGEWVAYVSAGVNDADISRVRFDGTDNQQLTDFDLEQLYTTEPPMGVKPLDGSSGVYIPQPPIVITPAPSQNNPPNIQPPIFNNPPSPDIVTTYYLGGRDLSPTWSPDGKQIAFLSDRYDGAGIRSYMLDVFVMNADGTDMRRLTHTTGATGAPQWSPDGEWIAFVDDSENVYNIYRMRPDGSDMEQLTNNTYDPQLNNASGRSNGLNDQSNSWAPAWSPPISLGWNYQWSIIGGNLMLILAILTYRRKWDTVT